MTEDKQSIQDGNNVIANFGTFNFEGKGPGIYCGGVVKCRSDPKADLLDSANSFLKAADRCLNGCKIEKGVDMLIVPGTVCASLSCELFLKFIILTDTGETVKDHHLINLFKKCSKEIQSDLIECNASISNILAKNDTQFVKARYHHEKDIFSFCQPELLQTAEMLSEYVAVKYPPKNT